MERETLEQKWERLNKLGQENVSLNEQIREYKSRIHSLVETVDFLKQENTALKKRVEELEKENYRMYNDLLEKTDGYYAQYVERAEKAEASLARAKSDFDNLSLAYTRLVEEGKKMSCIRDRSCPICDDFSTVLDTIKGV